MKKIMLMIGSLCLLSTILFTGFVNAHVVVDPEVTTQGTYEKFTIRVPSEKEIPTTKIEIQIPENVDISRLEPKSDWRYEISKDAADKITSITWTAIGKGLSAAEFGEFQMQGKVASEATVLAWKAYQTYQDGSVVEWIGANGSDNPAPVTIVQKTDEKNKGDKQEETITAVSKIPLCVSIVALILSLFSIVVTFKHKK